MITIDEKKRNGCGARIVIFPADGVRLAGGKAVANGQSIDCETCVASCPAEVISLAKN